MIADFFIPEMERREININHVWIQQSWATAHLARASMAAVGALFSEQLIARLDDLACPPRSRCSRAIYYYGVTLRLMCTKKKPRPLKEFEAAIRNLTALINEQLMGLE